MYIWPLSVSTTECGAIWPLQVSQCGAWCHLTPLSFPVWSLVPAGRWYISPSTRQYIGLVCLFVRQFIISTSYFKLAVSGKLGKSPASSRSRLWSSQILKAPITEMQMSCSALQTLSFPWSVQLERRSRGHSSIRNVPIYQHWRLEMMATMVHCCTFLWDFLPNC